MNKLFILIVVILLLHSCRNERVTCIESLLSRSKHPIVEKVMSDPDKYELQVRYTTVDRRNDTVLFKHYNYRVDSAHYFYPASTVKMPTAFAAVEFVNELSKLKIPIDIHTPLKIDSSRAPQTSQYSDSCTINELPSVAGFVKEIFTISDNEAYNRLYALVNQKLLNEKLYGKGVFTNSHISSRVGVSGFNKEENSYSNSITFFDGEKQIFKQLGTQQKFEHTNIYKDCIKGKGYLDSNDSLIMEPFNMCDKNFISIQDLERTLMRMIDQESFSKMERFNISEEDRAYILDCMQMYPREVECYKNNKEYTDNYSKFLMFGNNPNIPDHIEIYNKIGLAYGYLTDCAYIKDTKNKVDFYLTCSMSVNENQIYNDGIYEYDEIGFPFMAELGRIIHQHELDKK